MPCTFWWVTRDVHAQPKDGASDVRRGSRGANIAALVDAGVIDDKVLTAGLRVAQEKNLSRLKKTYVPQRSRFLILTCAHRMHVEFLRAVNVVCETWRCAHTRIRTVCFWSGCISITLLVDDHLSQVAEHSGS